MVSFHANKELLCNMVFSGARGELREHAMKCVGMMGTFVDVSDYDKEENKEWGLSYLMRNRNYKSLNMASIFKQENLKQQKMLHRLMSDGIASGVVKPLIRVVYSPAESLRAFRYLTSEQRVGRVLINMMETVALGKELDITTRVPFSPVGSYIVVCDENFLGVELASWLVKRGVKKVILHQKNSTASAYFKVKRETWKKLGVLTVQSTENLEIYSGCATLLKESQKIGPVQGIFMMYIYENGSEFENNVQKNIEKRFRQSVKVVSNLHEASLNICYDLSHFVVISPSVNDLSAEFALSAIENICEIRNENEKPALLIRNDVLNEINTHLNGTRAEKLSALFDSLEISLKNKYSNVVTCTVTESTSKEFAKTFSKINGISKIETYEDTKPLSYYKISEAFFEEIRDILNRIFKIDYSTEELKQNSIPSFKQLCNNANKSKPSVKGLRAFYRHIERDEILAAEPIIIMPSKMGSCINKVKDELYSKEAHLIMIPGFEGSCRIFSSIGERLKIQAAALQLSPDLEGDTIREMAQNLLKHIKETFEFNTKFYILGYSFGVNIALELAALLEIEGYIGVVYCLDSSPDAIKVHLNGYLGKLTESELQNSILTELYKIISGKDINDLIDDLNKFDDWPTKVEHYMKRLQKTVTHSYGYLKAIIESTYKRIILAKAYKPDIKLESKLVLMKGIAYSEAEALADDYNLSKYSKQPVSVFNIESDHTTAPYDGEVSNVINKMLEPKLLEQYKNQNLCEVYSNVSVKLQGEVKKKY